MAEGQTVAEGAKPQVLEDQRTTSKWGRSCSCRSWLSSVWKRVLGAYVRGPVSLLEKRH